MQPLGDLPGGVFLSHAWGVNADGSVVVGRGTSANGVEAFRWTQADGMQPLGDLPGGLFESIAFDVNADGSVVVGQGDSDNGVEAFRWTQAGGMQPLGGLGGTSFYSRAQAVNADGSVVVGWSNSANGMEAFRWENGVMQGLGDLPGGSFHSEAYGVNADGSVVVGYGTTATGIEAFRWTQAGGMQSVADWLADNGVTLTGWTLSTALSVSDDGTVVVGWGQNPYGKTEGWLARAGGLISPVEYNKTLAKMVAAIMAIFDIPELHLFGLHGRPGWKRRSAERWCTWVSGDFGRDDHGDRKGRVGLGEAGLCWRPNSDAIVSLSIAYNGFSQKLDVGGKATGNGVLFGLEGQLRLVEPRPGAPVWMVLEGMGGWSDLDIRRGYMSAGSPTSSRGDTSYRSLAARARLEWENAISANGRVSLMPFADVSVFGTRVKGYTETGGPFPARFDAMSRTNAQVRLGADIDFRVSEYVRLYAGGQYVHMFGKAGRGVSGEVIGLYTFSGLGASDDLPRDWGQFRLGAEVEAGRGSFHLAASATTRGCTPSWWLTAGYRLDF